MKLTHRQVEFFKAVMEQGSITGAAVSLRISQPAVSKALGALEAEIGLPLFQRTQNGLVPTVEARAFYTEVERSFSGLRYLSGVARDLTTLKHGRLVVGVIPALSNRWLPLVVARFIERFPEANMTFEAFSSPQMAQLVGQGRIDMGLAQASTNDPAIQRTPIVDIEVGVVLPRAHPLAAQKLIQPQDLAGQTFISLSPTDVITRQLDSVLASSGVTIQRRLHVSLGSTLCNLVGEGVGIGLVDAETYHYCRRPGLVCRRFEPRISMPISLLRSQRRPPSLMEHELIDHMRRIPPIDTIVAAAAD
ncbi:LysR substrate-binding domain-containing protein [Aureimonas frigidaquae]|uniref:Probable LysR-family transcriptional regulator n=1 Tax=Aureimonas frigidaquae TaxID=424757 RepID=A0A0P0Z3A5_9HYPH|nr:LysR substrate-binding domain-containing protein [Aureimonas frigidaquae]BAT28575.1 probable LysR-family transcriptional regulator [Aureimonas frigidaquae]